jgi:transcriptional regulator of acetoin/glycerol metabolism
MNIDEDVAVHSDGSQFPPEEEVRYLSIIEQLTDLKAEALAKAGGNYSQLARDLGIRRATVHSWFRLRNVFPRGRHIAALEEYVGGRDAEEQGQVV